ncbi:hypothetical protein HAX54_011515 [Datura stramonium]|uniref:Uncharacterized protein n=1 Tax=Datura stramonium TaxID=4076 RepID=A0ABS8Y0I5_DATST|nr:hypothetical protein [Datura stramonium]
MYVRPIVDALEVVKDGVPTCYFCGLVVGENVNLGDVSNLKGVEIDLESSIGSQEFGISEEDDLEVDDELGSLRIERRCKL